MKQKGIHDGHRQRLRQRALDKGLDSMPEHEVLELLLTYAIPYKDVNPLAHQLINKFGSLAEVFNAGFNQLKDFDGVGESTATFLSLFPEFCAKYFASRGNKKVVLNNIAEAVKYFRSVIIPKDVEEFYVFCLDGKYTLKKTIQVKGSSASSVTFSAKMFAEKIANQKYEYILIMHNHPGNNVYPTSADISATARIMQIAQSIGIKLYDHLVLGDVNYFSFRNNYMLDDLDKALKDSLRGTIDDVAKQMALRQAHNTYIIGGEQDM